MRAARYWDSNAAREPWEPVISNNRSVVSVDPVVAAVSPVVAYIVSPLPNVSVAADA